MSEVVMTKEQKVAYAEYADAVADLARLENETRVAQERFRNALNAMNQTVIAKEAE